MAAAACLALAAATRLIPSAPTTDPWGWIVWGREIGHLQLSTAIGGAPSWKPLVITSWKRGQTFDTQIGTGQVIPGWDQGLVGVKVGSRVQLDIPADLAYGETPEGGAPAGDLRFVVDILAAA